MITYFRKMSLIFLVCLCFSGESHSIPKPLKSIKVKKGSMFTCRRFLAARLNYQSHLTILSKMIPRFRKAITVKQQCCWWFLVKIIRIIRDLRWIVRLIVPIRRRERFCCRRGRRCRCWVSKKSSKSTTQISEKTMENYSQLFIYQSINEKRNNS